MRLDLYLNKEFNLGREKAKDLIKGDKVTVNDKIINKPSYITDSNDVIKIIEEDFDKYVSRGAYKLLQAIDEFNIDISDKKCLDVGASTGGFTDVLVQGGAEKIVAVDTGTLQLHEKLQNNEKIISLENTNILDINSTKYGKFDFVCIDVSFVSIKKIIPHVITLLEDKARCVFLVKPQFEVGKNKLNKRGIVKNPKDRSIVLDEVKTLCSSLGLLNIRSTISKTVGRSGNIEYLLVCDRGI